MDLGALNTLCPISDPLALVGLPSVALSRLAFAARCWLETPSPAGGAGWSIGLAGYLRLTTSPRFILVVTIQWRTSRHFAVSAIPQSQKPSSRLRQMRGDRLGVRLVGFSKNFLYRRDPLLSSKLLLPPASLARHARSKVGTNQTFGTNRTNRT